MIVVTTGYNAPVYLFDQTLVDRPCICESFYPPVCVNGGSGLPLRPAEMCIGNVVSDCFFKLAFGEVGSFDSRSAGYFALQFHFLEAFGPGSLKWNIGKRQY